MALEPKALAALALHRFGFGPREGSIAAIASDPREALLAELEHPDAGQIAAANLMSSGAVNRAVYEVNAGAWLGSASKEHDRRLLKRRPPHRA
jgi:uncharacterized protein (DUF1800 family)